MRTPPLVAHACRCRSEIAASPVTQNTRLNLYISILFDFRRQTTAILVMKNLFDAQSEEPGGAEGERQARIELARLDGVDSLPDTSWASAN
jgi:hypothetical protein